jgi:hypothetical protein
MAEISIEGPCGNNVGGLVRLVLYRIRDVVSVVNGAINLVPGALAFSIVFIDGTAEFQESLSPDPNGPFHKVTISAGLGKDSLDLAAWCRQNQRQKFIAEHLDANGVTRISGSKNFPLTLTYSTGTGRQVQDPNNRVLQLTGNQIEPSAAVSEEESPAGNFLVTGNFMEFLVTGSGQKFSVQ